MKALLEFDDAGAKDDEPVKGVTVGNIRAWHDEYDRLLSSWAECRASLSQERDGTARLIRTMREIEAYSSDIVMVNAAREAINRTLLTIAGNLPNPAMKRTAE